MNNIVKKSVVITGASSGIGQASVLRMLQANWHVFATVRQTKDRDRLLSENHANLTPVIMDVKDRSTIVSAVQQISEKLNDRGLDGLVNVAGIGLARPLEYATPDDMQEIFDINVFGQMVVTQAFLPLIRQVRGRIVNVTSVGVHIAIPFGGLLNGSKSAFGLLTDTLRLELHPFGIHVCTVEPGAITTPGVEKTLGNIEAIITKLPDGGAARYGEMLRSFAHHAYKREANGSAPDVVASAIAHALTSRRPRIRYKAGKGAKLLPAVAGILPDWLLDVVRLKNLGLPSEFGAMQ